LLPIQTKLSSAKVFIAVFFISGKKLQPYSQRLF
jgi:hypothetical protein